MENKKSNRAALIGAAFLMATSAIGPGFLTQTATFTGSLGASFGFVILVSLIMSAIAQLNIWRVLCSSGKRGQDVANELLPGLGAFLRKPLPGACEAYIHLPLSPADARSSPPEGI